jgi:Predicted integral membrane protein (DUF2269)
MSFTEKLVLWLHVAFALFTIGPLTVATMSTPRYIRARNLPVLRYLVRMTRIFSVIALGVLILGIVLAQLRHDFSHPWLSVSMTLFVVAVALLILVMRDQHRAVVALDSAAKAEAAVPAATAPAVTQAPGGDQPVLPADAPDSERDPDDEAAAAAPATTQIPHLASVERGRIASMAGLASVIWLVTLALMVWQP